MGIRQISSNIVPPHNKLASFHLLGPISIQDPDGQKLTPRGQKAQAILALLALAPRGQRTRAWLRDKLWSDSDEKHASTSLRQSIFEIKRDVGPIAHQILTIDRHAIGLRLDLLWVDVLAIGEEPQVFRQLGLNTETELLEGIDVTDPEFEDWLTLERQICLRRPRSWMMNWRCSSQSRKRSYGSPRLYLPPRRNRR